MGFCKICNEYAFTDRHQCLPQWDVWDKGNTEEDAATFYALDAQEAAEKAAEEWADEGPQEIEVCVRPAGNEREPIQEFTVSYELQVKYTATAC